jgi:hypothetical protein
MLHTSLIFVVSDAQEQSVQVSGGLKPRSLLVSYRRKLLITSKLRTRFKT